MDQILQATKEADYHLYQIPYWIKKKIFVWKNLLIIITRKLEQCNFEYWPPSQKHRERRWLRRNYNIYNVLHLLLYFSQAKLAVWVCVLKKGCQSRIKLDEKTNRNTLHKDLHIVSKSSIRTYNQPSSTNKIEQVLFGTQWIGRQSCGEWSPALASLSKP